MESLGAITEEFFMALATLDCVKFEDLVEKCDHLIKNQLFTFEQNSVACYYSLKMQFGICAQLDTPLE